MRVVGDAEGGEMGGVPVRWGTDHGLRGVAADSVRSTGVAPRCGGELHRKFRHSSDIELRQAVTP